MGRNIGLLLSRRMLTSARMVKQLLHCRRQQALATLSQNPRRYLVTLRLGSNCTLSRWLAGFPRKVSQARAIDLKIPAFKIRCAALQSMKGINSPVSCEGIWFLQKHPQSIAWNIEIKKYTGKRPQTCGGRSQCIYHIQAAVAASCGTATNEVRHYPNCSSRGVYIDPYRGSHKSSYKNFPWASQENFHTSTNAEHLQVLIARTSWRGFQQDIHKIFSQRPSKTCTRSCKDT